MIIPTVDAPRPSWVEGPTRASDDVDPMIRLGVAGTYEGGTLARFLITYHGPGMPSDPATMEQAKAAFGKWVSEAGDAVVDPGAPVRMVTQVAASTATEPAEIGGYSIIEAESQDAAVGVLHSHPYVARGGTLQVNEIFEV